MPVDDAVSVEVLECEHDFGGVESCARLVELARPLDLEHEIAAVHVLHHEEETVLKEATVQGGPSASGKIYVDIKFKVPSLA